jgi:phage gpG-like protein
MAGESALAAMVTASQIAGAIDQIRFDKQITAFNFSPSLGIVAKRFAALADEFGDLREPLRKSISDVMTISILENFMSGGRPSWPGLAPSTQEKRQKEGSGDMILVRSGSLADVMSSEKVWAIGKTAATIKDLPERVWYGKVHQGGLAGNQFSGGNWFKKYEAAARKIAGPDEDDEEVTKLAYKIFDKRVLSHGPAPKGQSDIPARPFAMFQEEDIDAIQIIFADWVEEKVREAGL